MTRDVLVSITGARFSEHDKEDVEMIIGGDYFWKNGKHYVLYEEVMEESGEVVKNTVKITPDSMDILKKGSINTHMVFQKGQKNVSCYLTPVGELTVGIETRDIEITETEDFLKVDVEYALEINYDHIADCSIRVITFGPILAFTTGTFAQRMYFGVCSYTIFGRFASLIFIFFLSMTSMDTVCAAASIRACCSTWRFSSFLPRKYRTARAATIMIRITSITFKTVLTGNTSISVCAGLCAFTVSAAGAQTS